MSRRALPLAALMLCGLCKPALAQSIAGCDPAATQGLAFAQCLVKVQKQSEDTLATVVNAAISSIATREGIYDSQRARWRTSLTASQNLWTRFSNDECQDIAPYEGRVGAAGFLKARTPAFEARTICMINMNTARAADLARRYSLGPNQPEQPNQSGQTP